jgi:hypothetical protein
MKSLKDTVRMEIPNTSKIGFFVPKENFMKMVALTSKDETRFHWIHKDYQK